MKKVFKILLYIFTCSAIIIGQDKVGTTIFRWAEIETGARAISMGGSQVASGNGVYAIPSSFLIGKNGNIIWKYPGAILKNYDPQTFADLVYKIEKELKVE